MSSLAVEREVKAFDIKFSSDFFVVALSDGRTLTIPLVWYPRLVHATETERQHYEFIGNGEGIHWSDLDEDISISALIAGKESMESQDSLSKWLKKRK